MATELINLGGGGDSNLAGYQGWSIVFDYQWGSSLPVSFGGDPTAPTVGPASVQDFTVTKHVDGATALLYNRLFKGTAIPRTNFVSLSEGDDPKELIRLAFKPVYITNIASGGSTGEPNLEVVSFTFSQLAGTVNRYDQTGSLIGSLTYRWKRPSQ